MGASELRPGKSTRLYAVGQFLGQLHGGDAVVIQHFLMGGHGQGLLAFLQLLEHSGIHEIGDHHVGVRVVGPQVANDSFHPALSGFSGMSRVLIVVHRELHEEQVYRSVIQNISLETEGSRGGAGGGNARIGEGELGFREALL